MVILGGMGNIPGVVVGTLLLIGLPGLLDEFEEYRLLVYGVALIMVMRFRPEGLVPTSVAARAPREDETAPNQWLKKERHMTAPAITAVAGGGGVVSALLEVRGLVRRFGGLNAVATSTWTSRPGRDPQRDRPQRCRQDHLLQLVTGLYAADDGTVASTGTTWSGSSPTRSATFGIARTFQTVRLFANMTVLENIMVGQHCRTR